MVHHWMLPLPQRHIDDRECLLRAQEEAQGHRTGSGGGPEHGPGRPRKQSERDRDSCGADRGGSGGHDGAFPSLEAKMGVGETDVEHGPGGQGRPVTDGLYPRDRPKSL